MSGKMPIFAVLGLGLVASISAAVLMAALRTNGVEAVAAPTTIKIIVVKSDIPPMTRIIEDFLDIKEVAIVDKPKGAYTDPVQVLGKLIKSGLVAGQPILETVLLKDEGGAQLASSLPTGMRAVSVEIKGSSAMRGLLFPGCRVDVIVAYKIIASRRGEGPVSRTLLQNVSVLAVEDKTVFTEEPEDDEDAKPKSSRRNIGRGLMVTLMVDPQQARELQSARDLGELSLSLRNPLDSSLTADPAAPAIEIDQIGIATETQQENDSEPWKITVIRGGKTEVLVFGEDAGGKGGAGKDEESLQDRHADAPTEFDDDVE